MRRCRTSRGLSFIGTAAAASVLAAGCGSASGSGDDRAGTLTLLHTGADLTFGAQYWTPAKFLVFEPMAWLDREGRVVPRLARSWEHSTDYREWTYYLRTEARWQDGTPVTSRDVKSPSSVSPSPIWATTGTWSGCRLRTIRPW